MSTTYYHPIGILLPPHWNFITTPLEFYYHPIGILLPPISTKNLDYKPFLTYCNQVINQVSNQVINQVYLSRGKNHP